MINANELRRGNWVKWDNADMFYQIENINENTGSEEDPIPLNPEILEKAGFVFNENYDNYRIQINGYFYSVKKVEDKWHLFSDSSDASCYILTELKYLHQLQNIIFALEYIELEIKL